MIGAAKGGSIDGSSADAICRDDAAFTGVFSTYRHTRLSAQTRRVNQWYYGIVGNHRDECTDGEK